MRLLLLASSVQITELACAALIAHLLHTRVRDLFSKPVALLLPFLLSAISAAFVVYWLAVRLVEKRRVRELELAPAASYLALGAASGFLLFGSVYATIWAQGHASYEGYAGLESVPAAGLIFATGVVFEELIFRGAVFRIVEDSLGTTFALVVSAIFFGLSHLRNEGATFLSTLSVATAGGILFGLTYTLSRSLWLPIGIHFGWNFTQGALFGSAVSGYGLQGAFKFHLSGPPLVTGGVFGPEASIYTICFGVVLAAGLGALAYREGQWIPPRFRMILE